MSEVRRRELIGEESKAREGGAIVGNMAGKRGGSRQGEEAGRGENESAISCSNIFSDKNSKMHEN